jgi:hypothetical protein
MTVVETLFGVPWETLDEARVTAFLKEAGDEGLTWEVKGDLHRSEWPRREQIEKAVCGFANSRLGGVLIVGAERTDKRAPGWTLPGLQPPLEAETELAISRTIRTGVRPTPPFRVKAWEVGEGRKAAVVWVAPVDRPPSITRDGRVYERTTGATEPVSDPAMLSRLFAAGERASIEAEEKAGRVAVRSLDAAGVLVAEAGYDWSDASSMQGRVGVGLAATGYAPDIGDRLFRRSFGEAIERQLGAELRCVRAAGFEQSDKLSLRQQRENIVARLDPRIGATTAVGSRSSPAGTAASASHASKPRPPPSCSPATTFSRRPGTSLRGSF